MTQRTDGIVGGHGQPEPVCEHGTALDVHCCNCHSGFLFDANSCVCVFDAAAEAKPALDLRRYLDAAVWLNFETIVKLEAEREAHLAQSIEQLEAELLMVKQFLHEPGTDLEVWVDGCLARVKALAALVQARPPETEKPHDA